MRKGTFRLRTSIDHYQPPLVVLTYNLQDVQPWKQATPWYQTAVYEVDASGLVTNTLLAGPFEYRSEEEARRGHAARVAELRAKEQGSAIVARLAGV